MQHSLSFRLWFGLLSALTAMGWAVSTSAQEAASPEATPEATETIEATGATEATPPRLSDWLDNSASDTAQDLRPPSPALSPRSNASSNAANASAPGTAETLADSNSPQFGLSNPDSLRLTRQAPAMVTTTFSRTALPEIDGVRAVTIFNHASGDQASGFNASQAANPAGTTNHSPTNGINSSMSSGSFNSTNPTDPFSNSRDLQTRFASPSASRGSTGRVANPAVNLPGSSPANLTANPTAPNSNRSTNGNPFQPQTAQGLIETDPALPAPVVLEDAEADFQIDVFPSGLPRAIANGRSAVELEGTITDRTGTLITDPVTVTLTASAGTFIGADQDPDRPGFQTIARQGRFVAALQSSLEAQQVRVRAAVERTELDEDYDGEDATVYSDNVPGFATSTAISPELEAFTQVEFVTELRPSLLAGTINLRIGESGTDYWGSFEDFLNPDEIDDGVDFDLNAGIFAIGAIGDWQFTGAYNSERTLNETCDGSDRLFRDIQHCEQRYPVYGDSSTVDTLTPSQDSLYLRFQRDALTPGAEPDYFMWGDYATREFSRSSQLFTATSRNLHGFKANYSLGNLQLTALYADNVDGFQRDTIPPDGTSGYYFLSRRLVIPGSEQVFLETEELNRPGVVVERIPLQRGPDYEIDYDRGAVLFRRPVQATEFDIFGNSLVRRIVVTYQFEGGGSGDSDLIAGRAQYNLSYGFENPSWIGISYLSEDQGDQDFDLFGIDFLLPIADVAVIEGEFAHSDHTSLTFGDVSGSAYRLEGSAAFADVINLRAYYRSVEEDFANDSTFSFTPGQTRLGGAIAAAVTPTTRVNLRYDFEENFGVAPLIRTSLVDLLNPGFQPTPGAAVDNTLSTFSFGVQQDIGAATLNVNFVDRTRRDRTAVDSSLDTDSTQLVSQLTVPLADRLTFQALNAASLSDDSDPLYPERTALGLNWAAYPGVNLRLTQQFLYGDSFDDTSITSLDTVIDQRLDENTYIRNRYSIIGGINGIQAQSALGLNHAWIIAPGLRLNLGYERIQGDIFADTAVGQQFAQPYTVAQSSGVLGLQSADSYSIGLEYTDDPDFKASARFEHRDSEAGNNTVWFAAAAGRLTPELTVLARYQQSNFANQLITGILSDTASLRVGLAYRDPDDDSFNGLLRYEYRNNPGTTPDSILVNSGRGSEDHTFALEGIYAPNWRWEFYGKYALRYTNSFVADDLTVSNAIHLAQGRVAYRLGYRWDVAGDVRWIGQTESGFDETGLALELGYYVSPNLRVGLGYSFGSVDDDGFTGYRSDGGPYLAVNFKVNELLRRFGAPDLAPPQLQETAVDQSVVEQTDTTEENPAANQSAPADAATAAVTQAIAAIGDPDKQALKLMSGQE